jgi:hypothetical protein
MSLPFKMSRGARGEATSAALALPDRSALSSCPEMAASHLETAANLLRLLERVLADFSKCALKSLDNQADFDSAIPRFESWRPSQITRFNSAT